MRVCLVVCAYHHVTGCHCACLEQQLVRERGLAMVYMRDDAEVADAGDRHLRDQRCAACSARGNAGEGCLQSLCLLFCTRPAGPRRACKRWQADPEVCSGLSAHVEARY